MKSLTATRITEGLIVCTLMVTVACAHHQELRLKTYVNNAVGLREGAPVRVQGVELGKVTAIRVRPQPGRAPVEIDMLLTPAYDLRIPTDARVRLEAAGVLGPTFAEIDVTGSSGPPLASNGVLEAQEQPRVPVEQLLSKIAESVRKPCKGDDHPNAAVPAKRPPSRQ